ncbi:hypothetical protein ACFPMF_17425 [Larkinella bovis]|uniref:Uncharacterized protein n=1 Tax=Larkinella bovis TaxID=683041 RepID=A0ABW0IFD1_9BACT
MERSGSRRSKVNRKGAGPVPGLLAGGPNGSAPRQEKCERYTPTSADERFIDALEI